MGTYPLKGVALLGADVREPANRDRTAGQPIEQGPTLGLTVGFILELAWQFPVWLPQTI